MKVKVGNTIYSGEEQSIMVILTEYDKFNISHMAEEATRYAVFPDSLGLSEEDMLAWMLDDNEQ